MRMKAFGSAGESENVPTDITKVVGHSVNTVY